MVHPARRARRPGNVDDQQQRGRAAHRIGCYAVTFTPEGFQRQPLQRVVVQDLKYAPRFPARFHSLHHARDFMDEFVAWYNHEHRHSGIGLHTPADVFYGLAEEKDTARRAVLADARTRHPHRFTGEDAPKIIDLPETAAINPPKPTEQDDPATAA